MGDNLSCWLDNAANSKDGTNNEKGLFRLNILLF